MTTEQDLMKRTTMEASIYNLETGGRVKLKNNKNRQMEEEDEEMGGCKGELEQPMDGGGGREGGRIP